MSANIPVKVMHSLHSRYLSVEGYKLISQGKTRDIYDIGDNLLLIVASDRLSIFDFVLNCFIPFKGEILTALNHFWMTKILKDFPNHLVNSKKFANRNMVHDLNLSPELMRRSLVVKKLDIIPEEIIIRGFIGGSVYDEYRKTGIAGGNVLPKNLPKWSWLDHPIFTPSTKAKAGHDVNYDKDEFFNKYGSDAVKFIEMFIEMYHIASDFMFDRRLILLDVKGEGDLHTIGDEFGTPDCARICDSCDYLVAMSQKIDPPFFDKEMVRIWGREEITPWGKGINKLDPKNDNHLDWVHSHLVIPDEVILGNMGRNFELFERITGLSLNEYQKKEMMIG